MVLLALCEVLLVFHLLSGGTFGDEAMFEGMLV